jgi:hypothetical protein
MLFDGNGKQTSHAMHCPFKKDDRSFGADINVLWVKVIFISGAIFLLSIERMKLEYNCYLTRLF